ncbi:ATP-binding protein [Fulvivirga sediminis]|uniref:histidine kinase n=1 Tax=Fulvivirga sediminis TaxID=2803949 RepID=A0A937JZ62_9BACT|nr:ATP-binding protein [Fulvivirga sediminis]MBL3656364.1 response regulator [Fulvivirga sediminis]
MNSSKVTMQLDIDSLDFDHCEDEPIHIPESIQGYGYLFGINFESGIIAIISENVQGLLAESQIIGSNFYDLIDGSDYLSFLKETYQRAQKQGVRLPVQLNLKASYIKDQKALDYYAVVYESSQYMVIELEPAGEFREAYSATQFMKLYATSVAPKFKAYKTLAQMADEIVSTIKYVSGYDRVVLFKFNDDNTGKVIAEAKEEDMDSYMDLMYPATDIPKQARALYKKNWVRLTPDVNLEPSIIIPEVKVAGREPLDMTKSLLRSLSPIHLQYVRNQGLEASMSMSLVTHDHLWGIISCHNRKPKYIPQNVRLECENLSQLFSWHLYAKEEELTINRKKVTEKSINSMLDKTSSNQPIVDVFRNNEKEVLEMTDTDGFLFYTESEIIKLGTVPDLEVLQEIYDGCCANGKETLVTRDVREWYDNEDKLNGIRGVLLAPLVENKSYFTAWFRKEKVIEEKWAGVPEEKSAHSPKKERLMPRSSFNVHRRTIRNKSKEWNTNDIETAERFNKVFMAHVLEVQDLMRQNIDQLQQQSKYKNEFLATLAHELRNPLTPLTVGITLLEEGENDPMETKIIGTMKRQLSHMTTLIDDLMDVSRITQGKVKLEKERLTINNIINNAIETCQRLLEEKSHELQLNLADEDIELYGDNTRLTQVFVNIINNAAKYTDVGGIIAITVEQQEDDKVSVKIKDNGAGISKDKLDSIFTMFTQIDAYSTKTKGGLGIGLTLVEKLVTLHDGEITARSDGEGEGTEFEVMLPTTTSTGDSDSETNESEQMSKKGKSKVMIVDDNVDVVEMYELMLMSEGYEIATAFSGKEAIEKFKSFKPDFALFDIGMPDMDGFELCAKLKETPEAKNTIFISQSGWGNKDKMEQARDVGFDEHLIKPVDKAILRKTLSKYIE